MQDFADPQQLQALGKLGSARGSHAVSIREAQSVGITLCVCGVVVMG